MEKSKITLKASKIDQNKYKSNLNEMKRGKSKINQLSKKKHNMILIRFTNFKISRKKLMIIH